MWYNIYVWCEIQRLESKVVSVFLKKSVSNGKVFLSFVQGYCINGKVKHKTIEKIGYLDELKKIYSDPIAHFKSVAVERNLAAPNSVQ
jgi:hypothetical protein